MTEFKGFNYKFESYFQLIDNWLHPLGKDKKPDNPYFQASLFVATACARLTLSPGKLETAIWVLGDLNLHPFKLEDSAEYDTCKNDAAKFLSKLYKDDNLYKEFLLSCKKAIDIKMGKKF